MTRKPIETRTAEDRAKMRKIETTYFKTHPEALRKKMDDFNRRYESDPEFKQRCLEKARLQREKKRFSSLAILAMENGTLA